MFRAIELGGSLPIARIAEPFASNCKEALEAGAGGIIVPMIKNKDQVKELVRACAWPPEGDRGVGYSRANLYGLKFDEYKEEAQSPLFIAQIENVDAVNNLESIIEVKGLDAVIIGPYDLSASMGITGEFENPLFLNTIRNILEICRKKNMPCGDHIIKPNLNRLKQRKEEGYQFIAYSIDAVLIYENAKLAIINN